MTLEELARIGEDASTPGTFGVLTKPLQVVPTDETLAEFQEGFVEVGAAIISGAEASELKEPAQGAFDNPKEPGMHLWCRFYIARPTMDKAQVDTLHSVINELLPQWSSKLCAARDEDSTNGALVGHQGSLYDGIWKAAAPKRGLGSAVLTGAYQGVAFFLSHCYTTLPPTLNRMSIEVYGASVVEGQAPAAWARQFFEALAGRWPVRYGNVHSAEEFGAKNLIDDDYGTEAIGVGLIESLPGLYWLNYLGAPYVDLIGRDRLLTAPAYEVKAVGDGVLLALDSSPDAWDSAAYREREEETIAHLGKQYFFSRFEPDRTTIAPEFTAGDVR